TLNVWLSVLGLVMVTVFVPPAEPVIVMSEAVKVEVLIGWLKTAVKLIGLELVGSDWPVAWLIVTAGPLLSTVYTWPVKLPLPVPLPPSLFAELSTVESSSARFRPIEPLPP